MWHLGSLAEVNSVGRCSSECERTSASAILSGPQQEEQREALADANSMHTRADSNNMRKAELNSLSQLKPQFSV